MSIRSEAEENLRVIRNLMEKATIYRAISAPGALIAGLGAVLVTAAGFWLSNPWFNVPSPAFRFVIPWLVLLVVSAVVNVALLQRNARLRGEPFFSPGMRLALRAMLPALIGGGVITVPCFEVPFALAPSWVLFYGISLLAASHFAPKSICWLGRAFFVAGVFMIVTLRFPWFPGGSDLAAHIMMGATFGGFHIVYAACIWPRRSAGMEP